MATGKHNIALFRDANNAELFDHRDVRQFAVAVIMISFVVKLC